MKFWAGMLLGLALLAYAVVALPGCASWAAQCSGARSSLPCTCPSQTNPGCEPPLNDDNPPWAQDAKRKTDGGTDQ